MGNELSANPSPNILYLYHYLLVHLLDQIASTATQRAHQELTAKLHKPISCEFQLHMETVKLVATSLRASHDALGQRRHRLVSEVPLLLLRRSRDHFLLLRYGDLRQSQFPNN